MPLLVGPRQLVRKAEENMSDDWPPKILFPSTQVKSIVADINAGTLNFVAQSPVTIGEVEAFFVLVLHLIIRRPKRNRRVFVIILKMQSESGRWATFWGIDRPEMNDAIRVQVSTSGERRP
jgi:hypothetical protein